ncbi:efflux RND transporter periplasmic adaptor subunit, partial [Duganella sp. FT134W]|nr:efflux RND transporter periplasmic adaptor subunit [Duganella margarita]
QASRAVAGKQYALLRAGAWRFDLDSQQRQYEASQKAAQSAAALLERYTVRAPVDGVVLALRAAVGAYASSQGVYDTYTQGYAPLLVMGGGDQHLGVRCYIDEILISRIPPAGQIAAQMFVRGTNIRVPLEFVRIQPYVGPKIALSDQRQERVDLRVLPVVFRFQRPPALQLYPGQLVDVYVGRK